MDLSGINWLAVLMAALVFFGLGAIWYGPLFGKRWQHDARLSNDDIHDGRRGKIFASAFIMAIIVSAGMAIFLHGPGGHISFNAAYGAVMGAMIGVFFILPTTVINYTFARRPVSLILIDGFYHIIAYTIVGAMLGAWQ